MSAASSFQPLAADTGKPVDLAMQRLWLSGQILPAGARLVVQHVFRSAAAHALEVIYCFPLPRDAALRSFRITGEGFEAHSELKPTEAAVKAYEDGVAKGTLSTLARQYGDGLINLAVGNIRPNETVTVHLEILCGVELNDDGFRFRFPFTLAPAYHPLARFALTGPGEGEMELPPSQFGDMILPGFREDVAALHQVGFDLSICGLGLDEIGSPSHVVKARRDGGSTRVALAVEKDVPNRDLVLDARFRRAEPQVLAGLGKDGIVHFAAIVPSSAFGTAAETPRRVVILLDRSGSMEGEALSQARKAIAASLGILSEADLFGLIAFDDQTVAFRPRLVSGVREMRDEASQFLAGITARGGTELSRGFRRAATLLEGKGGDIFILTDGQVSGTEEILAAARSAGVRLHCLGIGSASQDRFLALLSRETGGVSRFVTPRERVDITAVDLFAGIGHPIASELTANGNVQPEPPSLVFSGVPVLLFGEAVETLQLSWKGGQMKLPVDCQDSGLGETVRLLQGSRLITDWESRYPSETALATLEIRKQNRVTARLLALSETYGLASREMSLVAVVTRTGDRSGELPETLVVPVGMAQDTAFGAYFVTVTSPAPVGGKIWATRKSGSSTLTVTSPAPIADMAERSMPRAAGALFSRMSLPASAKHAKPAAASNDDILLDLASNMNPDGGMSGANDESRAAATVLALLAFLSQGHTPNRGAFRSHVVRLISFLASLTGLSNDRHKAVDAVIELARKGQAPAGDWVTLARSSGKHWNKIESAVLNR